LKVNLRRLIQWKSVVGGKPTQMKPFQPRGSHFETFAQLRGHLLQMFLACLGSWTNGDFWLVVRTAAHWTSVPKTQSSVGDGQYVCGEQTLNFEVRFVKKFRMFLSNVKAWQTIGDLLK
jgi:hypothetical protein